MSSILSQSRSIFYLFAESALEQDLFQIRSNFHLVWIIFGYCVNNTKNAITFVI